MDFFQSAKRGLAALSTLSAIAFFFLASLWWRWPNDLPYFAGFMATIPAALFVITWALGGFGRPSLWEGSAAFLLPWGAFITWAFVSQRWARFPAPAGEAALQIVAVGVMIIALTTTRLLLRWVIGSLVAGLCVQSAVAILQVAVQGPIGLGSIGEYGRVAESKLSTLTAEGFVYLRPYGLTVHPNLLGGFVMLALIMALASVLGSRSRARWWPLTAAVIWIGWFALLLSFSRAAWLGFAVGGLALAGLCLITRFPLDWRRLAVVGGGLIVLGVVFIALFRPFVVARAGLGDGTYEQRSVADRALFTDFSLRMIRQNPLIGVGVGMNDWESAQLIVADPRELDLAALPVHNVPLLILSELGVIGFGLWVGALIGAASVVVRYVRRGGQSLLVFGLIAGFCGLSVTGLLDFYMWRHFPYVILWLGSLGMALSKTTSPPNPLSEFSEGESDVLQVLLAVGGEGDLGGEVE